AGVIPQSPAPEWTIEAARAPPNAPRPRSRTAPGPRWGVRAAAPPCRRVAVSPRRRVASGAAWIAPAPLGQYLASMRPSGWLLLTQLSICLALAGSAALYVHYLSPLDSGFCGPS